MSETRTVGPPEPKPQAQGLRRPVSQAHIDYLEERVELLSAALAELAILYSAQKMGVALPGQRKRWERAWIEACDLVRREE